MVLVLDSLLISPIKFVLEKVADAVEAEMDDDTNLKEELLAAQMKLELGEISDEEFSAIEAEVLARLREIREARGEGQGLSLGSKIVGADVSFDVDFDS